LASTSWLTSGSRSCHKTFKSSGGAGTSVLSTWLRDYLYIPLGGNRDGGWKTDRNLLTTMLLGGLWHGANWTFVVLVPSTVSSVHRALFSVAKKKPADAVRSSSFTGFLSLWSQRILTFNIFCLSLVFFRSPSLSSAVQFLGGLFHFAWRSEYVSAFVMLCMFSLPLLFVDLLLEASDNEYPFAEAPYAVRTGMAVIAFVVLAVFSGSKFSTFIYFPVLNLRPCATLHYWREPARSCLLAWRFFPFMR